MNRLNCAKIRLVLIGFVAAMVLGGGTAKADFTWTRKADMPITRYMHSTSVVGGKIYVIGGWHAIGGEWNPQWDAPTRVDEYDPATDTWTRKADMTTARGGTCTSVVNEKIYVIGGDAGPDPVHWGMPDVEVYDPVTDTWTQKADMPTSRFWFSTGVVDGIIYVIGGKPGYGDGSPHLATVEAYDPTTNTWTRKADMPSGRSLSSSCVVDGKIYVIGGAWNQGAVEAYDPQTNTWTVKSPMPTPRYSLSTSVVDGKIYAIGGWWHSINGPIFSTVEVYDPHTDTWKKAVDIPVTTANPSTSVVGEKIYVFGGATATHAGEHWVLTSAVYVFDAIVDFNGDGIVNSLDLCIMVDNWHTHSTLCDIAPLPLGDGFVDIKDLIVLAEHLFEEILPAGLIAYWKLDEPEGSIAPDSAGESDGTLYGGPLWQPNGGMVDGALQFDGIDDYVSTPYIISPANVDLSIFAWMKGGAPGQVILSQERGANWLMADPFDGALKTDLKEPASTGRDPTPPGPALISPIIVTDDDWHRVGFVRDYHNRILYVDDVEVARDTATDLEASGGGLYIGTGSGLEPGTFWSGLIDDIRIYNRTVRP